MQLLTQRVSWWICSTISTIFLTFHLKVLIICACHFADLSTCFCAFVHMILDLNICMLNSGKIWYLQLNTRLSDTLQLKIPCLWGVGNRWITKLWGHSQHLIGETIGSLWEESGALL
jgi:hypothetical protein